MLVAMMTMMMAGTDVADLLKTYRDLTRAEIRCEQSADRDEILVCGARNADRYRLPFIAYDIGNPRREGVFEQAERLQHKTTPCQDMGPYLVGCGMVGVGVTVGGRGTRVGGLRPPAP
ncbi:MAG: hypothetical protein BVN33_13430 [Proteobacteria bacterium ST_bin13]|nr:MAG: hypothetical protein BVN33_13430 [Proteobacteria bacterium ST_bin13]